TAFRARIMLTDYVREQIDAAEVDAGEYDIGKYEAVRLDYVSEQRGTTILATQLKRGFINRLRSSAKIRLPTQFDQFFAELIRENELRKVGEYWRTVWSLALALPLPYFSNGPVRSDKVYQDRQQRLINYNFHVSVDGMSIYRPILLPPREEDL